MSVFLFSFDSFVSFFDDFLMILFVFWLTLFKWSPGQVEYVWVFQSILWIVFQDLSCYVFFFVVKIFVTTIWHHNHFKSAFCSFVHAIATEVRAWRHILLKRVFCSFAWSNFWSQVTYLTLKNDFLTLKLTFVYFNSKRWGRVNVCNSKWRLFEIT